MILKNLRISAKGGTYPTGMRNRSNFAKSKFSEIQAVSYTHLAEHAARYLESLECVFRRILEQYIFEPLTGEQLSLLESAEQVPVPWDM